MAVLGLIMFGILLLLYDLARKLAAAVIPRLKRGGVRTA